MSHFQLAVAILLCTCSISKAEVSATISLSGNTVNEGDTGVVNYSFNITVDNPNYRFVDGDGSDGSFTRPDGFSESIFLTNTASQEMQSGTISFTANDQGIATFNSSLSGSADLQTISGGVLGSYGFSASQSTSITILNVAPEFDEQLPDLVIPFGDAGDPFVVPVSVSANDPGLFDTLTFEWDAFLDGVIDFTSNESNRESAVNVFLPASGFLDIEVSVNDGDGGSDVQQFRVTGLPGDYNQDDVVDAADYTVWRDQLGTVGTGLPADGNRNGEVDIADYDIWVAGYGEAFIFTPASVPEPSSLERFSR